MLVKTLEPSDSLKPYKQRLYYGYWFQLDKKTNDYVAEIPDVDAKNMIKLGWVLPVEPPKETKKNEGKK